MLLRRVFVIGISVLAACSSGGGSTPAATSTTAAAPRNVRGPANRIIQQEINALGAQTDNAYDIVERLRPTMLRSRGPTSFGAAQGSATPAIIVFLDDARLGDLSSLRNVQANLVKEIRYHTATEATQLWGTGYGGGAIQVISKK
jgi:hypothetical protein